MATRSGGWVEGHPRKLVKSYKLPAIRYTSTSMAKANTAVWFMGVLLNSKSFYHKEKKFFGFLLYLYEMMNAD